MQILASRAGHSPLALTLAFAALTAVAACRDEPVAPRKTPTPLATKASAHGPTLYVTNTSGGTEVGSLRWAADQIQYGGGGTIVFDSTLWR